ncbi:hypothetical protein KPP23_059 [Pseudomonas phage KPP23]|nr:hypothetical protein RSP_0076 [Pseudomonas phage RSP]BAO53086.1 hypothetical protein KPP23_059 [Pseudomonas phage KPP23]
MNVAAKAKALRAQYSNASLARIQVQALRDGFAELAQAAALAALM